MKSHASMNRNCSSVEEGQGVHRGDGGSGNSGFVLNKGCHAALVLIVSTALFSTQAHAANAADATVTAGSGSVATAGNTTTINQTSQRLAIDWTSLSTRANEALVFNQPNASAIALNRIIGSSPSELLGSLTANGQVFILNPNGVLFGAGSQVNVGGLVASTLAMSNTDFMAGNHVFTNSGGTGSVVNQGTMTAASGGYLALLAPEVRNEGVMVASLGTALLAAGNKVTLNLDNGSLLGYSIDQGAINALAENKQLIQADGGQVILSAKAMNSLTTATVNNTGIIEARTIQNKAGRILLMGDMAYGTVNVGGTLDASAPTTGDGGFVETSAAQVNIADSARITTKAESGKTGQWLVDPFDFVVASAGGNITGAALGIQLDNNNVTLNTTSGNLGINGDLSVNDTVSWSAAHTLTLIGERDVNVNANLTYSGSGTAGVTVQAVRDINVATNTGITSTGTGALPVVFGGATLGTAAGGNINMAGGSSIASKGGDVTFRANAIQLSGATVASAGGNIDMTASGTNQLLDITNAGATESNVSTAGGQISLAGDRMNIAGAVNAGAGRVLITPTSTNRQITLAGADENIALNLSNAELNRITAGILAIGGTVYTGGIVIGNSGGAINMVNTSSLSLITESATGLGTITQNASLTVANLSVDTGEVTLSNASNQISQLSGRAGIGNFTFNSASALSVGTVDGRAGITGYGHVTLTSGGVLTATGAGITTINGQLTASSVGGMRLDHAGIRFTQFGTVQNIGAGDIVLRNSIGTTFSGAISNGGGRIDIGNTGNVTLNSTVSSSNANTGGTAGTAAISVVATGRISAGSGGGVTNSNGGSVYLEAGNGYIGANLISVVTVSTSGAVTAVAAGGTSQVNLALAGGATVENISAVGAVRVSAAAGDMAVKTVSGSAVTLSAATGAILDTNGTANNITAGTLNATAANGITLGTNVTGQQTLNTTGAAGDISITAANALNASKLTISTNAGAAQTVSVSSNAGITVDTAFGNAQDNFKLIATGGNLNINAALTANKLSLSTTGTSAQTAAITASGLEMLGTGSHTLNNAGNAVTTLAGNTGNVDYAQTGALAIGTVNTAGLTTTGKVLVRTTGAASDLTVANAVSAGSTASDALVLAAGRNFVNSSAGATPLSTGSGGRYLVYSTDPTANTFGGMTSPGNAFNRSYDANGPADALMTSIAGNRFVYSVQPTLDVSGDNKTRFVGGGDPALTYTVNSGLVTGDTAASALAGALSAPTGAAVTGPTHAIMQGTLASSLGYAINYTPGTLIVTNAPVPAPAPAPAPAADASLTPTAAAVFRTAPTLVAAYNSTIETVSNLASAIPGGSGGGVSVALDPGGAALNASAAAREQDAGDEQ
ncbi:MAG: filamentous hemagglutinin N-terminal protein [Polaromonas sp.]|nr:filamentous hemagglutinin N-terminal protein [Polaromonas sp.]